LKLSLVIPVYNESPHLQEFFERLFKIKYQVPVEYIIVDDRSTDQSWQIVQEAAKQNTAVRAFRQDVNRGKGAALHKGFELASGEIIAVQDADFEYDPRDLIKLIQPIIDDQADIVFGSRFRATTAQVHNTFHYLINRLLTMISNIFSGLYLSDMETCYKVFRADILKSMDLESKRFGFEPEVTALVAKLRVRVHEYAISYFPRGYLEGKKINWKDGVAALWFIFKYNAKPLSAKTRKAMPAKYLNQ